MSIFRTIEQIDGNLLIGIQHALNADWLTPIMKAITFCGEAGWLAILFCAVLVVIKKTRKIGWICTASIAFTFILCNLILKPTVDRLRPWEVFDGVMMLVADPGDASFPSGHAANNTAVAFAFWLSTRPEKALLHSEGLNMYRNGWLGSERDRIMLHKFSYVTLVFALLICVSRLYLGMHFPTDVLSAILIALIITLLVYRINLKFVSKSGIING